MTTLWKKEWVNADQEILKFTVGDDAVLDNRIIPYDIIGSLAHAVGLEKIGILTAEESRRLGLSLKQMHADWSAGHFSLGPGDEDAHTALERRLTDELGEIGKKIHAGRSRNDQVLTALRLYMKAMLLERMELLSNLAGDMCELGAKYRAVPMPGYTHMQRAMPSTLAFWYAAFAEGFTETLEAGQALHQRMDSSPLGAAAGFGVPLPLDREYTAKLMGFGRVQINAMAVQNSRGRLEAALIGWLAEIGRDVEKLSWDLLLFSSTEFDFVRIPESMCTGSSIMPQKKNADVLELLRATPSVLQTCRDEVERVITKLPSSYHRDLQLTKSPLMRATERGASMLVILKRAIGELTWNTDRLSAAVSQEMFATHRALGLVQDGIPFRNAYASSARELRSGDTSMWPDDPARAIESLMHMGAPGNPGIEVIRDRIDETSVWLGSTRAALYEKWDRLLG